MLCDSSRYIPAYVHIRVAGYHLILYWYRLYSVVLYMYTSMWYCTLVWCCTCIHACVMTCWYSIMLYLYAYVVATGSVMTWLQCAHVWFTYLYCMIHSVCVNGKYNVYICLYWPVVYCLVTLAMHGTILYVVFVLVSIYT